MALRSITVSPPANLGSGMRFARLPSLRSDPARRTTRPSSATGKTRQVLSSRLSEPHLQLATAKLPRGVSSPEFLSNMYQWAATLTSSGQNLPFVLPVKTDKLPEGFQISLCNLEDKGLVSVGNFVGTVEEVPGTGAVFFVRFYLGDAATSDPSIAKLGNDNDRLQLALQKLVDADTIMNTMPNAIKKSAILAMSE